MPVKNLNLSLERGTADAASTAAAPVSARGAATTGLRAVREPPPRARRNGPARAGGAPWAVATIALTNMAFLVLAGLWLSGYGREAPRTPAPAAGMAPELADALPGVQAQLGELRRELRLLQTAIDAQRQLLVAAHLARSEATATPAPEAAGAATEPPRWHINLGEFSSRAEAAALGEQLAQLGHPGAVVAADGGPVTLRLAGFGARQEAEAAAAEIMARTSLNGLWVATGE